jgi:hypothetical protein
MVLGQNRDFYDRINRILGLLSFASLRAAFSRLSPSGRLTRFFREVKVVKGFAVSNLEVCEVESEWT